MKKYSIWFSFVILLVVFAMVLSNVQLANAQKKDWVEISGEVISIDEETGSFEVEDAESGETFTVFPRKNFDLATLHEGDIVEVKGMLNEDDSIAAFRVKIESEEDDGDPDDLSGGYYCKQDDKQHPFGERLAERYSMDYEDLQAWFCEEDLGWGQIMLALQTSQTTGDDPADLLELRRDGAGWGQIWQELKLIGRPEDAVPPNDEDDDGRPDFAGPPPGAPGKKP